MEIREGLLCALHDTGDGVQQSAVPVEDQQVEGTRGRIVTASSRALVM